MDFFEFNKRIYLLVVDYYSKFIEISIMNSNHNSESVIIQLKSIFSRHGIPEILISDNGPSFNSVKFKSFTSEWGISHITSSPYHSKSNGLVERTIGTIKNMLQKCLSDNTDPYIALLNYRNTPKKCQYSPAQLSMSRSLRTKLPTLERNLEPKLCDLNKIKEFIESEKLSCATYYNKQTKELPPLFLNDDIFFKKDPSGIWIPGKIIKVGPEPRSYLIKSNSGIYRRNRYLIKKSSIIDNDVEDFYIAPNNPCPETNIPESTSSNIENPSPPDISESRLSNIDNNSPPRTDLNPKPGTSRYGRTYRATSRFNY